MRYTPGWHVVILLAAAILPLWAAQEPSGRARKGSPGRPGLDPASRMTMRAIDAYWLTLKFELKAPNAKLTELRPKFQQAWTGRKKALDAARASGNFTSLPQSVGKANATLEASLKKSLGETQFNKLKETAERTSMLRHRGPGRGERGKGR